MTAWPVREWPGGASEAEAIAAAGGMVVVPRDAAPEAIRQAVDAGAHALELHQGLLAMLAGSAVEFLHVVSATADLTGLRDVPRLRSLSVDAWRGDLDLAALPALEWLHAAEVEPGQFESLMVPHPCLRHVRIGRYRGEDLSWLDRWPRLAYASLWQAPVLASPAGLPAWVEVLELASCPRLATLDGVAAAPGLQALVLERCDGIDDLAPLASLPGLRLVQLDMRRPPSLAPLAGHPRLAFVWVLGGLPPPGEVEALLESPELRMVNIRRASWMRGPTGWDHFPDIYAMSPDELARRELLVEDFNKVKSR